MIAHKQKSEGHITDPWVDMPIAKMKKDLLFSLVLAGVFIVGITVLSWYL